MREELIDTIKNFIKICEELHEEGKIDDKLFEELTKNKIDFLNTIKEVN